MSEALSTAELLDLFASIKARQETKEREAIEQLSKDSKVRWQYEYALALDGLKAREPSSGPVPHNWKSLSEIWTTDYGPTPWLIKGVMCTDALFCVAGDPKSSKTFALLEMALSVASGTPFLGEFEVKKRGGSALFLNEDTESSVKTRTMALWAGRQSGELDQSQIRVISRADLDLGNPTQVAALIADVRCMTPRPVLLGLDPLRNLHAAEENDSTEMSAIMRTLRAIRDLCACAVVFVHHSAKKSANDNRSGGNRLRGSSAVYGAVDGLISFEETENEQGRISNVSVTVTKHGRGVGTFRLALDINDDADGVATKAVWAKSELEDGNDDRPSRERPDKKTNAASRMMSELRRAARFAKDQGLEIVPATKNYIVSDSMAVCGIGRNQAWAVMVGLIDEGRIAEAPASSKRTGLVLGPDEPITDPPN